MKPGDVAIILSCPMCGNQTEADMWTAPGGALCFSTVDLPLALRSELARAVEGGLSVYGCTCSTCEVGPVYVAKALNPDHLVTLGMVLRARGWGGSCQ